MLFRILLALLLSFGPAFADGVAVPTVPSAGGSGAISYPPGAAPCAGTACMSGVAYVAGTLANTMSNSATQYMPFMGGGFYTGGWSSSTTIGAPMATPGVVSKAQCSLLTTNAVASSSYTITLFKNGVATSIVCSLPQGTQIAADTTHSVAYNAGDYLSWQDVPSGSPTSSAVAIGALFTDSSSVGNESTICASTTSIAGVFGDYYGLGGGYSAGQTTESLASFQLPAPGTIDNAYARQSNALGTIDWIFWHNGAATSLDVTATTSNTGTPDTNPAHAFHGATGDTVSIIYTNTSGGTATQWTVCARWRPDTAGQYVLGGGVTTGWTAAAHYASPAGGSTGSGNSTSGSGGVIIPYANAAMTFKNLQVTAAAAQGASDTLTLTLLDHTNSDQALPLLQAITNTTNGGVTSGGSPTNCGCSVPVSTSAASASNINSADLIQFKGIINAGTASQNKFAFVETVP